MRAIVQDGYGPPDAVLHLREIDRPAAAEGEVLVRVRAASVHPDVWHVVTGRPAVLRLMGSGIVRPKYSIPGTDVAGTVEAVGASVTRFKPGDEVFGETIRGQQWHNGGAFAEYVAAPADALARKPAGVTFEQAAAVPTSGLIALMNLQQAGLKPSQDVLVNGAAGGVGAIAVQLAKAQGTTVTGVDATAKLDLVRSLGADRVIDYTREDFTRDDDRYDLIFDVPGGHRLADCRRVLKPDGVYVLIGHDHFGRVGRRWLGSLPHFVKLMSLSLFVKQLPKPTFRPPPKPEQMEILRGLLEAGKLTPVVGRTYPLAEVPGAIRRLAAGDTLGKIVITM
jgi:NADPH:quinone reductase-like Zn-dependent oxidoreductase